MARDNITEQYARLRISAQNSDEYYRSKCDCELNNGSELPETFRKEAHIFFEKLLDTIRQEKRGKIV
jgi:L-threonylcarbamoyladenylate synthase